VIELHCGDWVQVLKTLPDESVNCVVTSPPYWGLRDYGIAGQIGLEKTPEEYVAKIVAGFREVRRVLRKDGTLWLNLGDSYAGSGRGRDADGTRGEGQENTKQGTNRGAMAGRLVNTKSLSKNLIEQGAIGNAWVKPPMGLKPKDLCMIPARMALALQADGWWLRMDIIWAKPNPMPESVTDRPTKSHEYVFLMSKSAKYYYDADAIAERLTDSSIIRLSQDVDGQVGSDRVHGKTNGAMKAVYKKEGRNSHFHQDRDPQHSSERKQRKRDGTNNGSDGTGFQTHNGNSLNRPDGKRNKRSVWTIATQAMKEAHFATFPEKLVEPCILAGCPEGGVVLDPFAGTCTVGLVAARLNRSFIGIDLNPEYLKMRQKEIDAILRQERMAV